MTWSFATSGSLPAFREICLILILGAFGPLFAGTTLFQASVPISGDFVPARLELEQQQDLVLFTLDIPPNEGDLLGLFGNISDEGLLGQLSIFDPNGIITDFEFKANSVKQVGGGNNVNPAKNWDFGLKLGRQGSGSGVVQHATFGLAAPGLTVEHFTQALNQGWMFGVRTQSTNGPEGSSKMGIGPGDFINRPPVIASVPPDSTDACSEYLLTLQANDPDGDAFSWSLVQGPAGMVINANFLSWKPDLDQQGSFSVSILADDSRGGTALLDFSLAVQPPTGQPPVFSELPQGPLNIGMLYELAPLAIDPDGDALSYTLVQAPEGLSIQDNGLSWTPQEHQTGDFTLEIQVTDGCFPVGLTSVLHVNAPPQVSVTVPEMVPACELFSLVLTGSDPDQDPLTWTLLQGPEGMILQDDSLTWQPTLSQQGTYQVSLGVEDGQGGFARQDSTLSVLPALGQAPVFATLPEALDVGQGLTINPLATDADGDELSFTALQIPEGLTLENNSLVWTPLENQVGIFPISIEVTDGCFTVQLNAQIQVIQPNRPPEITSTAPDSIAACEFFSYTLSATDPDGDSLVYSLLQGPEGMVLQGDTLRWTPTHDRQGSFPVSVLVQDGQGSSAQQDFDLAVLPALGQAPVFAALPETLEVGQIFSLDPLATDADGDELSFTAVQIPEGLVLENNSLSWTPLEGQSGTFPINLEVTDGCFTVQYGTQVTVVAPNPNLPPVIISPPVKVAHQGQPYVYQAVARDPDNDPLTWRLEYGPDGLQIDDQTGIVRWRPPGAVQAKTADQPLTADLLFLGTTLLPNGAEVSAARELGYSYVIVNPDVWATMTTEDFKRFRAVILGDPDGFDVAAIKVAEETVGIWGPAIDGNVMVIGTDPTDHDDPGFILVRNAIRYAAAHTGTTGAVVTLSGYYHYAEPFTPVPVLDAFEPGAFTASGVNCHNDVILTARHPVFSELTEELLSNWVCSVHNAFTSWSSDFQVLAMARNFGSAYTAPNGVAGTPYILARGRDLRIISNLDLSPVRQDAPLGGSVTIQAGLLEGERPLPQTPVLLEVLDGPHGGRFFIATSDASGLAYFTLDSLGAGTDRVQARFSDAQGRLHLSDVATINWQEVTFADVGISVTDNISGSDSQDWQITIYPPGDFDVSQFVSTPTTVAKDGENWSYRVDVRDAAGDAIPVRLDHAPIGMVLDPLTGRLDWVPSYLQRGPVVVCLAAGSEETTQWFVIDVGDGPNFAPYFVSQPPATAADRHAYLYIVDVRDPQDDAPLTLELAEGPAGMRLIGNRLSWNPVTGSYPVRLIARDPSGAETEQAWVLDVHPNGAPYFVSEPLLYGRVGLEYRYQLLLQDPEGDSVTVRLSKAPQGMRLASPRLLWTPQVGQSGMHQVVVSITDSFNSQSEQVFTLTIGEAHDNTPPVIASTAPSVARIGHAYRYQVQATDADGDVLTFQLEPLPDLPEGLSMDAATGLLTWDPVGHLPVRFSFSATDAHGAKAVQHFNLSPTYNHAPIFANQVDRLHVKENQVLTFSSAPRDADRDPLTVWADPSPPGMVLDANGTLSWRPDTGGVFPVTLWVEDPYGARDELSFIIRVNRAPVWQTTPPATAVEGQPYVYEGFATDADGDFVYYQLGDAVPGTLINAATGVFTWTPPADSSGYFSTHIQANDMGGSVTKQFITLNIVEALNVPPVIKSTPSEVASEGQNYSYRLQATDRDYDPLTWSLLYGPEGMSLSGAYLNWTPGPLQEGVHPVSVRVRDARGGEATQTYLLTVADDLNSSPQILSTPLLEASSRRWYAYDVVADDADGDEIFFELVQAPEGMTLNSYGALRWLPGSAQTGLNEVNILAYDSRGGSDAQTFQIQVSDLGNSPPYFVSEPVRMVGNGHPWVYDLDVRDADGDAISLSLDQGPVDMILTGNQLSWTASLPDAWVTLLATDALGAATEQTFLLKVNALPNTAPVIISPPLLVADAGLPYFYDVEHDDPDGFPILYRLDLAPAGMTIEPGTGRITWQPDLADLGYHQVTIRVTDGAGAYDTQIFNLNVTDPGDILPPHVFINIPKTRYLPGEVVNLALIAHDENGLADLVLSVNDLALELNSNQQATFSSSQPGVYLLKAIATDANGNQNHHEIEFRIEASDDQALPEVAIHAPVEGQEVSAPTQMIITVQDQNLAEWILEVSPVGKNCWTEVARGQEQISRDLGGMLDTSLMPNGMYYLRLTAFDVNFQGSQVSVSLIVDGNFKIGRFEVGFQDLNIPLRGIPVQLNRLYDSTNKCSGDFGYGWSMAKPDIRANITPGLHWTLDQQTFCMGHSGVARYPPYQGCNGVELPYYCIDYTMSHYFTVTLPGGETETFDLTMDAYGTPRPCTEMYVPTAASPILTARRGVTSKLEILHSGHVFFRLMNTDVGNRYQMVDYDFEPWNPQRFRLTTAEGIIYTIHREDGLESITDLEGNVVTYTPTAIRHSSGTEITLTRDNQRRITRATDPEGSFIQYSYDDRGDLVAVTDRRGFTTRYTYDDYHNLIQVTDPEGNSPVRMYYDEDGRLIAQEDFYGNRIEMDHDIEGRQEVITDRRGYQTTYIYDDRGNVLSKTDPVGNITRYTYDTNDNETSVTTAYGTPLEATITRTFDNKKNILSETNPSGYTIFNEYDSQGKVLRVSDGFQDIQNTVYNASGFPTSLQNRSGETYRAEYSYANSLSKVEVVNPLGGKTISSFSSKGFLVSEINEGGGLTDYSYNKVGDLNSLSKTYRDVNDVVKYAKWNNKFDKEGNLIEHVDPQGNTQRMTYDFLGRIIQDIDARGNQRSFAYDAVGNLIQTTYADGTIERATWSESGQMLSRQDRNGSLTYFEYDPLGQLVRTTFADGLSTHQTFDALGRIIEVIDAKGQITGYEFDKAGNTTKVIFPNGDSIQREYSNDGRLLSQTDGRGIATLFRYDSATKLTQIDYPDGTWVRFSFDARGRRIAETDQAGRVTRFEYSETNNLNTVIDALGNKTSYRFDAFGKLLAQTDALGRTTLMEYDLLGRLITRTLPLGQREQLEYDANGNLAARTDFAGQRIKFRYDENDRLQKRIFPDGRIEQFEYNALDQRTKVLDGQGTSQFEYDLLGRLQEETKADGQWIRYHYDENGNLAQLVTANQRVDYVYDPLNRLEQVTDDAGLSITYGYDASGNRTHTQWGDHLVNERTFDPMNRVTKEALSQNGRLLQTQDYGYDLAGNRISSVSQDGIVWSYDYDALNRLTREHRNQPAQNAWQRTYSYDPVSNRVAESSPEGVVAAVFDANDRLIRHGQNEFTYDDNGNMLTAGERQYRYDPLNRLTEINDPAFQIDYAYDVDGNRVLQRFNGEDTHYLVDGNTPLARVLETWGGANGLSTFTHGQGPLAIHDTMGSRYLQANVHGSITTFSDLNGNLLGLNEYTAWGATWGQDQPQGSPFGYSGEWYDRENASYNLRARIFHPETGRFQTMDSWQGNPRNPITLNKYQYGNANPVMMVDPSGQFGIGELGATLNMEMTLAAVASVSLGFYYYNVHKQLGFPIHMSDIADELWQKISDLTEIRVIPIERPNKRPWKEKHHPIPMYMCGRKIQDYVIIDGHQHSILHSQLYTFTIFFDTVLGVSFRKDKGMFSRVNRQPLKELADSVMGRTAITYFLDKFYAMGRYYEMFPSLVQKFPVEQSLYIGGETSCKTALGDN